MPDGPGTVLRMRGKAKGATGRYTMSPAALAARRKGAEARRAGRPRKEEAPALTVEERTLALLRSGWTVKATCRELGISDSRAYRWRRAWIEAGQLDPDAGRGKSPPPDAADLTPEQLGIDVEKLREEIRQDLKDRKGLDGAAAESLIALHVVYRVEVARLEREGPVTTEKILGPEGQLTGIRQSRSERWRVVRELGEFIGASGAQQEATPKSRTEKAGMDALASLIDRLKRFPRAVA